MGVELEAFRKCGTSTAPLAYTPTIEMNITLDILDGCLSKCPGCFVTRENKFTDEYLKDINNITEQYVAAGIEANELFLGPTDLFNTTNMDEVINDPLFPEIVAKFKALTFTSAFTSDPVKLRKDLFKVNEILTAAKRHCELFIVLDVDKFLIDDRSYLDTFEENLTAIRDCNLDNRKHGRQEINVFFLMNYHQRALASVTFPELHRLIKKHYQAKIKINPSFARATNSRMVEKFLTLLRDDLEDQIDKEALQDNVFLNMADIHFGGETYHNYAYTDGKLFVAPFIYDFVPVKDELFEVKRDGENYRLDDMLDKINILTQLQYEYANKTKECGDCQFLPNCVARHYLAYMKHHKIVNCLMPKKIFATNYKSALEEYND